MWFGVKFTWVYAGMIKGKKKISKSVYQITKLTQLGTALLNLCVAPNKIFNRKHDQKSAMP